VVEYADKYAALVQTFRMYACGQSNLDLNANVHEIVEIVFERYDASAWQDVVMYGLGAT
jgi:hypothetical protein